MTSILAASGYLPRHRLQRSAIGPGNGTRSVASFDEDTTSMAVEAARRIVDDTARARLRSLVFATTAPAYTDRTNATAIHRALDLDHSTAAYDMIGALRSTIAALRAAVDAAAAGRPTLVVGSDIRIGLPGSNDERDGGDAAAAVLVGATGPALADVVAVTSATDEFLDRWRVPGEATSQVWEERFGETEYLPLARTALDDGLKAAGLELGDIDHLIVTGLHSSAVAATRRAVSARPDALVDDLQTSIGVSGAAHPLLLLTDVLERATSGQHVVLLCLADGADCIVLRTGELAGTMTSTATVTEQLAGRPVEHQDFLVWRGLLQREPPRRPDPDRPAAPPSSRGADWKFGFVGARCTACGTRHLPPERVCLRCHRADAMEREPLADARGTVTTFAIDHLAFTLAPPMVVAVVDLDGGGRLQCEVTDVDPATVAVGDRVEMTFRRMHTTADGVHNYFWKARPLQGAR